MAITENVFKLLCNTHLGPLHIRGVASHLEVEIVNVKCFRGVYDAKMSLSLSGFLPDKNVVLCVHVFLEILD